MKLAAALFAAAALAVPAPAAAAPGDPVTLTTSMRATRGTKKFAVLDGDTLKTGDEIEMFVQVNQPAYVYVVQFFADGTSAVLFPQECPPDGAKRPANGCGDILAKPGVDLRVPEAGDFFALDENRGNEHVYFLASREPIAKADKTISGVITNIRRTASEGAQPAAPARKDPPPPPPKKVDPVPPKKVDPPPAKKVPAVGAPANPQLGTMLSMSTRKLKRVNRTDGQPALQGEAESRDANLVVVRFSFNHD
jgi:hypothetical protein